MGDRGGEEENRRILYQSVYDRVMEDSERERAGMKGGIVKPQRFFSFRRPVRVCPCACVSVRHQGSLSVLIPSWSTRVHSIQHFDRIQTRPFPLVVITMIFII